MPGVVDKNAKLAAYQEFGVTSYWIFDPRPDAPELTAAARTLPPRR